MSMTLQEMLEELLRFYPIQNRREEDIAKDLVVYRERILEFVYNSNEKYDWEKCLKYIQTHRTYKTFPAIPDILDALPHSYLAEKYQPCANEDSLLVVTLPTGYQNEFTVSSIGKPLKQLEDDIKRKFGECTYQLYPKGTVIIGGKIYLPEGGANDTTPQSMESPA
ncbi:MAG: hypothetical protein NC191_07020 [Muribaculaceae bacterium]|nr:hypothetical protein [Muribaculaceae bacterium]